MVHCGDTRALYKGLHRVDNNSWEACVYKRAEKETALRAQEGRLELGDHACLPGESCSVEDKTCLRFDAQDAAVARLGAYVINQAGMEDLGLTVEGSNVHVRVEGNSQYQGMWRIKVEPFRAGLMNRIKQWLPFTRAIQNPNMTVVSVKKITDVKEGSLCDRVMKICKKIPKLEVMNVPEEVTSFEMPWSSTTFDLSERLTTEALKDPFTELAACGFQNLEPKFLQEQKLEGEYQFTRNENGKLILKKTSDVLKVLDFKGGESKKRAEALLLEENKKIVRTYLNFVNKEYGSWYVKDVKHRFDVDLEKMILHGEPLLPEHVYRMNLGAHDVDERQLRHLVFKLNHLMSLPFSDAKIPVLDYMTGKNLERTHERFSYREMRSLLQLLEFEDLNKVKMKDLQQKAKEVFGGKLPECLQEANSEQIDGMMHMILPRNEAIFDRMFTGRKITDKAIMGYYTACDRNHFKPWVDLHEQLQIFEDLKNPDMNNFYELLGHVVSKKNNVMRDRDKTWRTGRVIPAPVDAEGKARYYMITSCVDNDRGSYSYTLEPLGDPEHKLPSVKLYRSTASNTSAINGNRSLEADLSLAGPGAANRDVADIYEMPFMKKGSMKVWAAYYHAWEMNDKTIDLDNLEDAEKKLRRGYEQLKSGWADKKSDDISFNDDLPHIGFPDPISKEGLARVQREMRTYFAVLHDYARREGELLESKDHRARALVGHSLGAAQAQGAVYHYYVNKGCLPLPGQQLICYSSDGPGMGENENDAFLHFGRSHTKLMQELGISFQVTHQFEYGDPVPTSGACHLGATEKYASLYQEWLNVDVAIFKPKQGATAKTITAAPTHGRRIGGATEGADYTLTKISPHQLRKFDRWWNPFGKERYLADIFGLKLTRSRAMGENTRQLIAYARGPILRRLEKLWRRVTGDPLEKIRDKQGRVYVRVPESHALGKFYT